MQEQKIDNYIFNQEKRISTIESRLSRIEGIQWLIVLLMTGMIVKIMFMGG